MDNINDNSLPRYLIGASRIKYSVLDELFSAIRPKLHNYKMLALYVDAHAIFMRLYRDKNITALYGIDSPTLIRDIVVGFLNVLGHYRRYFATRFNMDNDIYVAFNRKKAKYNTSYCKNFGKELVKRYNTENISFGYISEILEQAWKFIIELSPHFEGIYCIDNNGIDDFATFKRIGFRDDIYYLIYSRSDYALQLLRSNVSMLYGKRDKSRLITDENVFKDGILHNHKTVANPSITPNMLPLLWTLTGCHDVSVDPTIRVARITTGIKIMNKMCENGDLMKGISIQSFLDKVGPYIDDNSKANRCSGSMYIRFEYEHLIDRYKALSVRLAAKAITSDQWERIKSYLYDIYDQNSLEDLNDLLVSTSVNPEIIEIGNLNMSEGCQYYNY